MINEKQPVISVSRMACVRVQYCLLLAGGREDLLVKVASLGLGQDLGDDRKET